MQNKTEVSIQCVLCWFELHNLFFKCTICVFLMTKQPYERKIPQLKQDKLCVFLALKFKLPFCQLDNFLK